MSVKSLSVPGAAVSSAPMGNPALSAPTFMVYTKTEWMERERDGSIFK